MASPRTALRAACPAMPTGKVLARHPQVRHALALGLAARPKPAGRAGALSLQRQDALGPPKFCGLARAPPPPAGRVLGQRRACHALRCPSTAEPACARKGMEPRQAPAPWYTGLRLWGPVGNRPLDTDGAKPSVLALADCALGSHATASAAPTVLPKEPSAGQAKRGAVPTTAPAVSDPPSSSWPAADPSRPSGSWRYGHGIRLAQLYDPPSVRP